MKKSIKSNPAQLPSGRKSSCSIISSLTAVAAGLALLGGQSSAFAQADNFNDGNDTAPTIAWIHNDPLADASLGGFQHVFYTFPGGNKYKIKAEGRNTPPIGLPAAVGPARGGSLAGDDLTSFYVSVDVDGWDPLLNSAFGILARITTPGLGTTHGYAFTYQSDDKDVSISRINGEEPNTLSGSGSVSITLDPLTQYRMVFQGVGNKFEGRIYDVADLTTPLVAVYGTDTSATPSSHGSSGLVVYDNGDGLGGADGVFDNFFSATNCPATVYSDDFNDGNDTSPAPAWTRVDPIALAGVPVPSVYGGGTFTSPNQDYQLFSPVPGIPNAGGPRVYSIRGDRDYSNFFVSVDVLNWDSSAHIIFGIMARAINIGPGTTDAYIFSWENGNGSPTSGDFDLLRITGEGSTDATQMEGAVPGQSTGYHLTDGTSYRFTFSGNGANFVARLYQLPNTTTPVKTMYGLDNTPGGPLIPSGKVGVVVFDHPEQSPYHSVSATFDNFFVDVAEPRLSFDGSSGSAVISWPGNLTCLWVLESSATVDPTAVWTGVPLTDVDYSPATVQTTYVATTPMATSGNTYYRLRKL